MSYHTFGPGLALDHLTMKGVPATIAVLVDAETGEEVQAYSMGDDPQEIQVMTNRYGYFPMFQTDESVRQLEITFGRETILHGAWELIFSAEEKMDQSVLMALAAQQAAEDAAALIEAPVDKVLADMVGTEDTLVHRALRKVFDVQAGRTWVQGTPPPAGTTYEWRGTPHASVSIKRIDGDEVARNLALDPRFEGSGWWDSFGATKLPNIERGDMFDGLSDSQWVGTAGDTGNNVDLWQRWSSILVAPGQWVAIRSLMAANEGARVRQLAHWNTASGTQYSSNYRLSAPHGEEQIDVYQAPDETSSFTVRFHANRLDAIGYLQVYVGDVVIAVADTEAEALEQVRSFFDGDSPDNHANDVWFNTTDGYLPYFWDDTNKTWFKPV